MNFSLIGVPDYLNLSIERTNFSSALMFLKAKKLKTNAKIGVINPMPGFSTTPFGLPNKKKTLNPIKEAIRNKIPWLSFICNALLLNKNIATNAIAAMDNDTINNGMKVVPNTVISGSGVVSTPNGIKLNNTNAAAANNKNID